MSHLNAESAAVDYNSSNDDGAATGPYPSASAETNHTHDHHLAPIHIPVAQLNDYKSDVVKAHQAPPMELAGTEEPAISEEPVFLGDIVWSWIVNFVRWVMRNPKTFSGILVTIMLVLFTKYAQDIVVEVVNLVVKAHPAVSPTDELRSKTAVLGNELRSVINVARTAGAAYIGRNVTGSSLDSLLATEFMNVPFALQTSFGGNSLYFVYVSYLIPSTTTTTTPHWGDCGCQYATSLRVRDFTTSTVADNEDSPIAYCSYVDNLGVQYAFNGTNYSSPVAAPMFNMFSDDADYIGVIQSMTIADQTAGGVWHAPTTFDDPVLNRTIAVLTYSYPLAFDRVTGKCTAAVSVDMDRDWLSTHLKTKTKANNDVVMVGYGRGGNGGGLRFVLENLEGSLTGVAVGGAGSSSSSSFDAFSTPLQRVNRLASVIASYVIPVPGIVGTPNGVMQNLSFVSNGMIYQSLTVLNTWSVLAIGPTSDGTPEIGEALMSLVAEFERSASSLRASHSLAPETCIQSATANRSSMFLRELSNLLKSFGPQVHAAYVTYPVPPSSTAPGISSRMVGACGCEQLLNASTSETSLLDGGALSQQCFIVQQDLTLLTFDDPKLAPRKGASTASASFLNSPRSAFLTSALSNIARPESSSLSPAGSWTAPYPFAPTNAELISYILPLEFEFDAAQGGREYCSVAIVVELSLSVVPRFLSKFTRDGSSEVHLVDMESLQYMGSSSTWFKQHTYPWNQTPNVTVNFILNQLAAAAGSTNELRDRIDGLSVNAAQAPGSPTNQVLNYARVYRGATSSAGVSARTRWGLIELLPSDVAQQQFYPVPSVTSSSQALALLPMDVNLRLFSVVLALMFIFTLNLFVLGCSTVGEGYSTYSLATTPAAAAAVTTPMPLPSGQTPTIP